MANMQQPEIIAAAERIGRYRWAICGLLFAATAINYVDRQMIGLLKPTISHELGWSEETYADVIFWFQAATVPGSYSAMTPDGGIPTMTTVPFLVM